MSKPIRGFFSHGTTDVITTVVVKGALPITVVDKGSLESSKNQDAYCQVEGQTTIIMIMPEGTPVKKGELVCQLDSASLKDSLTNQKITTKSAEANHENAKLTREVAEIAVVEYEEGIFKQDSPRSRARSSWPNRTCRVPKTGSTGPGGCTTRDTSRRRQKISEELTLKKARFALEQAESKKKVLVDYTKGKTIKELKSEVEKARSDELAKKATCELEDQGKEAREADRQLRHQGARRRLVVYANDPNRAFGSKPAPDRGRGDRARAAEDLQPAGYQPDAGQHQGP